ncbi:hypothetical protein PG996_006812 [Apiospora saccharicola]|uniref:BTB domain-containing protein n=1 Tax=Apiospora saccharicola TaxID=335842 RepID=A0ABR1VBT1_9PEZI
MAQRTSAHDLLLKSGKELFNNRRFSDAEIIVGDRVWPVHRSILCPRSVWFNSAFTNGLSESHTAKVTLREQDPDIIHLVLQFLYACDETKLTDLTLVKLLELYRAADFFGIDSLGDDIISHLNNRLLAQATGIWKSRENPNGAFAQSLPFGDITQHWSDEDLKQFFSAAHIAFADCPVFERPRQAMTKFLRETGVILGKEPRFMCALKDQPELAVVMVELLMDTENQGAKSPVYSETPRKCDGCNKAPKTPLFAQTWVVKQFRTGKLSLRGLCQECFGKKEGQDKA